MICDTFDNLLEPHVAEYIESETILATNSRINEEMIKVLKH